MSVRGSEYAQAETDGSRRGGGKNNSARAVAFATLVEAIEGIPLVNVLRSRTCSQVKSEGYLTTYLFVRYIWQALMVSSHPFQWVSLAFCISMSISCASLAASVLDG